MTATASGSQVPFYPQMPANATVEAFTATETLTVADMFTIKTNTGAGGNVPITLPAASVCAGCVIRFAALAAQTITLEPAGETEKIFLHGSGVANKHLVIAGVIGNYADLYSDGENWHVARHSGVCTKEA